MRSLLDVLIRRFLVIGSLRVEYPDASRSMFSGEPGPAITVQVTDWRAVRAMVLNPALALGEGYMDATIVPVGCGIYDVLDLLTANLGAGGFNPVLAARRSFDRLMKRWAQFNPAHRARRNAAHHYDLDGRLYALFLDRDRQYSCAYFPRGDESLDQAQTAKKRHIAAKLCLDRPGLSVLDIGCGWGGMALTLAREHGAQVLGITLSEEQLVVARRRAVEAGLDGQVRFELMDYRAVTGRFDRIVSVGMFEHVGVNHYGQFFRTMRERLTPDGIALVHAIGRGTPPAATNPWITKYIFPGGYNPALSEVLPAIERSGLAMTDLEVLRLHYARTLRLWRGNLMANAEAAVELYDERFLRMFEFYLCGSELAFRRLSYMVWQVQLAGPEAVVPPTRDYIARAEAVPG